MGQHPALEPEGEDRAHLEERVEREAGRAASKAAVVERVADSEDSLQQDLEALRGAQLAARRAQDGEVGLELLHVHVEPAPVQHGREAFVEASDG